MRQLKTLCPTLGKAKIAETLARMGLDLGASTVGRMLKEKPPCEPTEDSSSENQKNRVVTSKYPNHLWNSDLTVVPTMSGFWTSWCPFALPQQWPFSYWLAVAEDHYSRKVMGAAVFDKQPLAVEVRTFLSRTIRKTGSKPKHLISDKGVQFYNKDYKNWCRKENIKPRFGAIGRHGSIAVTERLILTLKTLLSCLLLLPLARKKFELELGLAVDWYNRHRPT